MSRSAPRDPPPGPDTGRGRTSAGGFRPGARTAAASVLLSAAAGAVDLVAVVALGGAFAGIVTGNLVTLAGALATRDPSRLVPVATAVAGFTLGVATCTLVWRRSREPRVAPLVAELVLLGAALGLWTANGPAPVILALVSVALGAQSVVGLKLNSSTTYMTGVLTVAVHGLVAEGARHGRGSALTALRQLGALMVGAVVAALLLGTARWAALAVPTTLVATAVVILRGARTEDVTT